MMNFKKVAVEIAYDNTDIQWLIEYEIQNALCTRPYIEIVSKSENWDFLIHYSVREIPGAYLEIRITYHKKSHVLSESVDTTAFEVYATPEEVFQLPIEELYGFCWRRVEEFEKCYCGTRRWSW